MQRLLLAIAVVLGGLIAFVDSRPTWDDTGITLFAIVAVCGVLGLIAPERPWRWALAVGIWVPLVEIPLYWAFAALVAPLVAFVGAYAGTALRKLIAPPRNR